MPRVFKAAQVSCFSHDDHRGDQVGAPQRLQGFDDWCQRPFRQEFDNGSAGSFLPFLSMLCGQQQILEQQMMSGVLEVLAAARMRA